MSTAPLQIRPTTPDDLPEILEIYQYAREFMRRTGNPNQWGLHRPATATVAQDIARQNSYVICSDNTIAGVFTLILGNDPTYEIIENGSWLNDLPYGTIHRIAGNGTVKGIFNLAVDFALTKCDNLRIDTHADNKIMQHLIKSYGFVHCGTIYTDDGTPRAAFAYSKHI